MNAGIVFKSKFVKASSKLFKNYINYIDRDEAVRSKAYLTGDITTFKLAEGYINYMDNPQKASELFTANKDRLDARKKQELKDTFSMAQEKGSVLWQSLFSFDSEWLQDNSLINDDGIVAENKLKEYTRTAMGKLMEKEGLEHCVWSAAIHHNTDNYHIHIAMVDPNPTWIEGEGRCRKNKGGELYQRGKFKQSTINSTKATFANLVIDMKNENSIINGIVRTKIVGYVKAKGLSNFDKDIENDIAKLINELPEDLRLWKYGNNAMINYRDRIDSISDKILNRYFSHEMKELNSIFNDVANRYENAYGTGKTPNNYKENKLQDLHYRLGNAVLQSCRGIVIKNRSLDPYLKNHNKLFDIKTNHRAMRDLRRMFKKNIESIKNMIEFEKLEQEKEYEQNRNV